MLENFPVMASQRIEDYAEINVSSSVISAQSDEEKMNAKLKHVVDKTRSNSKATFLYGGYLEQRDLYRSSDHFGEGKERNIHLGIDIWADAGKPIHAAQNGVIHSIKYNAAKLDYGYCMIIQYENTDYVLYGHLSEYTIASFKEKDIVIRGQVIGTIGDKKVNGGWEAHLHLQLIKDIGMYAGDYPGVCHEDDLEYYKNNCPDPMHYVFDVKKNEH